MANQMEAPPSTVIIVGAGISGLVAARTISRHSPSTRIIVLESSERVGGRTLAAQSTLLPAVGVDAGGQWIGARQHAAQDLLRELEIRLVPQYCTGKRVLHIGGLLSSYSGLIPSVSLCQLIDAQVSSQRTRCCLSRRLQNAWWLPRCSSACSSLYFSSRSFSRCFGFSGMIRG